MPLILQFTYLRDAVGAAKKSVNACAAIFGFDVSIAGGCTIKEYLYQLSFSFPKSSAKQTL